MYRAIRINLPNNPRVKQLSRTAGRIYSKTVSLIRKTHEKKGFWLQRGNVQKYLRLKSYPLHSQTVQALTDNYFDALISYFKLRNNGDENAKPPFRTPKYHSIPFKQSAIKINNNKIILSLGRGREPLEFNLPEIPKYYVRTAEICWDKTQRIYYLVLTIKLDDEVKKSRYKKAKAIDLGEIHPITVTDGKTTVIYNGRLVRSIKQYREKTKGTLQSKMDKCKKHSRRWWKLNKSKQKQLIKINAQVKDALHKITRHFANSCKAERIGLVIIGDLTGIRDNIDYGTKANQKLHQWAFAEITRQLEYKLQEFGIEVVMQDEARTSKTCPNCGRKNFPNNRNYRCKRCRFKYHRDGVGCLNILNKYRGNFPFSKQMELLPRSWGGWLPPKVEGIRFNFHLSNSISAAYGLFG